MILPGLDGATIGFTATFAGGATWVDNFGIPSAIAGSHSFTISGASVAASNGVYSDPTGFSVSSDIGIPEILFMSVSLASFDFPEITLGSGIAVQLGFSLSPGGSSPSVGDFIASSQFGTSFSGFSTLTDTLASSSPKVNICDIATVVSAPSRSAVLPIRPSALLPVPVLLPSPNQPALS